MNPNHLSYKRKNVYLVIGTVFFFVLIYVTNLKKTIDLYFQNQSLMLAVGNGEGSSYQVQAAEKKLIELNTYLEAYSTDSLKSQQFIMSEVSSLCRRFNVTLKSFPKMTRHREHDFHIETNIIEIQGPFIHQLQLLYTLETTQSVGRISSITYKSFVDPKNKKTVLTMLIYLQNVKKISHEI